MTNLSDEDVDRIAEAVARKLANQYRAPMPQPFPPSPQQWAPYWSPFYPPVISYAGGSVKTSDTNTRLMQ